MKLHSPFLLATLALSLAASSASGQEIKIAVIDMQESLNQYYKTEIQVKQINDLADEAARSAQAR